MKPATGGLSTSSQVSKTAAALLLLRCQGRYSTASTAEAGSTHARRSLQWLWGHGHNERRQPPQALLQAALVRHATQGRQHSAKSQQTALVGRSAACPQPLLRYAAGGQPAAARAAHGFMIAITSSTRQCCVHGNAGSTGGGRGCSVRARQLRAGCTRHQTARTSGIRNNVLLFMRADAGAYAGMQCGVCTAGHRV